jgi:hypothetical protein
LEYERDESRLRAHHELHAPAAPPDECEDEDRWENQRLRLDGLRRLHSDQANQFVNSDGFGVSRILRSSPYDLRLNRPEIALQTEYHSATEFDGEPFVELPAAAAALTDSGEIVGDWGLPTRQNIEEFCQRTQFRFASPDQNGLVRSVAEVAGFIPHAVSDLPVSENVRTQPETDAPSNVWWKINRLELVSLLKHDEYVVYQTDQLPDMEHIEILPTRPLNEFETRGLKQLFEGHDLEIQATPNRILMLGSLRASNQCLDCHAVQPGDLLGALSYELLRKPRLPR